MTAETREVRQAKAWARAEAMHDAVTIARGHAAALRIVEQVRFVEMAQVQRAADEPRLHQRAHDLWCQAFDEAWGAYSLANRLSEASHQESMTAYDVEMECSDAEVAP